jgi:hypothetical protein
MKHRSLPQTMTPENLAQWIKENAAETFEHTEKIDLEEDVVHELERQSSLASRAIDRLEKLKKSFVDTIKNGTPSPDNPVDFTIYPTKGTNVLKANREFADKQLEQGYKEEITSIYMIPYPEDSLMVAVDIQGFEWPEYTKEMTIEQINKHKPILRVDKKKKEDNGQMSFMSDGPTDESDLDL